MLGYTYQSKAPAGALFLDRSMKVDVNGKNLSNMWGILAFDSCMVAVTE